MDSEKPVTVFLNEGNVTQPLSFFRAKKETRQTVAKLLLLAGVKRALSEH